jgi:hypothetical protein
MTGGPVGREGETGRRVSRGFFFEFVQCRQSQRLKFKEKIGSVLYKSHFFVAIDQDVKNKVPFGLGFTVGTEWELKYLG